MPVTKIRDKYFVSFKHNKKLYSTCTVESIESARKMLNILEQWVKEDLFDAALFDALDFRCKKSIIKSVTQNEPQKVFKEFGEIETSTRYISKSERDGVYRPKRGQLYGKTTSSLEEAKRVADILSFVLKDTKYLYFPEEDIQDVWNKLPREQKLHLQSKCSKEEWPFEVIPEYQEVGNRFLSIKIKQDLPKRLSLHISGKEKLAGFQEMLYKECPGYRAEPSLSEVCWIKGVGPTTRDSWKEIFGADFLDGKKTVQWYANLWEMSENSLWGFFGRNPEFADFVASEKYFCKGQGYFRGTHESVLAERLTDLGFKVLCNKRILLNEDGRKFELDLFLPDQNIAFELNGSYTHSVAGMFYRRNKEANPRYHEQKTSACLKNGIKLFHLWEHYGYSLIDSIVDSKLGVSKRLYARRLSLRELSSPEAKEFFDQTHVDGFAPGFLYLGLCDEFGIATAIAFRHMDFNQVENARYASRLGTTVVGGFSRLLNKAKKLLKQKGYNKIISYCDRDLTPDYTSSVYSTGGFQFVQNSGLILKYFCNKTQITGNGIPLRAGKVYFRQHFQKHKLKDMFPDFYDESLTEKLILEKAGIFQIWNSGNWKFSLNL